MEFHQIRYFLKAAETLNFTRAANQCHVSQPALTRAIQKLEEELGGDLFIRDGRTVSLSPLGRLMCDHLQRIHETQDMARAAAKSFLNEGASELNVGVMCTIGPDVLSAFLDDFRRSNRDVLVILHDIGPEALPELLVMGTLDCAFIASHSEEAAGELSVHELFEEPMVVAFADGHRFSEMKQVELRDLAEESYVDRLKCEIRQDFFDFFEQNSLTLMVACSSQREDWIQELVIRGVGVSVMPRFSITTGRIGWKQLSGPLPNSRNILIARARNISPQAPADAFFSDAKTFQWQTTLADFQEGAPSR